MSAEPICPCDRFIHPWTIDNPPGLPEIRARVGDYTSFRAALLRTREGEQNLADWSPSPGTDLALQMIEWWAYLSDILTFYNERIANGAYLRTAYLPGGVKRIVRVLGYRPRPGVGATATVAALVTSKVPITLPAGFALQSKPAPGKKPEIFELGAETTLVPGGGVDANVIHDTFIEVTTDPADGKTRSSLLLAGKVTLRPGDELLALSSTSSALVTIASTTPEKDPRGKTNTRVVVKPGLVAGALARGYQLLRSTQETKPSPYGTSSKVFEGGNSVHLAGVARDLSVGSVVVLEAASSVKVTTVTAYTEAVWYANAASSTPETPPTSPTNVVPLAVLHTKLTVAATGLDSTYSGARVRYGWAPVGTVIDDPALGVIALGSASATLVAAPGAAFPSDTSLPVQIEDGTGQGISGAAASAPGSMVVTFGTPPVADMKPPFRVHGNLLAMSRGKTVSNEVLGSGDPRVPGQSFPLAKSPLTYLASSSPEAVSGLVSTLRVLVDGLAWTEVESFHGQPPTAKVYVTREDVEQKTTVVFGDGVSGARLPAGAGNVVASYRTGSGADAPAAGAIVNVLKPHPGLSTIKNPVAAGGGADPDPPRRLRKLAPKSVETFGRAISSDDYATIALGAPGVTRARAYFVWSAERQRTVVKLYVAEGSSAVGAAKLALAGAADPGKPAIVVAATAIDAQLSMRLVVDPARDPETLKAAVLKGLFDPETGLFGVEVARLGEPIYESRIHEAATRVEGVLAVHDLLLSHSAGSKVGERHIPGEGAYFVFDEAAVAEGILTEESTDGD